MANPLCLITGASSGIGAACARVYAAHGWDLVLTARREDRLRELAEEIAGERGAHCLTLAADLADPGAPEFLMREIAQTGRTLDGLVNNAGYGGASGFCRAGWDDHARFLQVMAAAPTQLMHMALPGMMARGYGRILNIGSIAGMIPPARGQSLYGAAKAYLIEASRAAWLEARGSGANVTALCPGLTRTEFHAAAKMTQAAEASPPLMWQSAEAVAEAGYEACEAGHAVHIPGAVNKLAVTAFRLLPGRAGMALMARASSHWESRDPDAARTPANDAGRRP